MQIVRGLQTRAHFLKVCKIEKGNSIMAKSAKAVKSALSNEASGVSSAFALPAGFKAVRPVTLPAIVIKKEGDVRYLRIEDKMYVGPKQPDKTDKDGKIIPAMDPPTLCHVTDVATGEMGTFVIPSMVSGNLSEQYPDDSYVGKTFAIQHKGKRDGKRYADFQVAEIAPE